MIANYSLFQRFLSLVILLALVFSMIAVESFAATGTDRYTALLFHGNGTDASTYFSESSFASTTVTVAGNAQIDTAQSKFGSASMLFDGSGDYISIPDVDYREPKGNDFTIDFWFRAGSVSSGVLFVKRTGSGTYTPFSVFFKSSGVIGLYSSSHQDIGWDVASNRTIASGISANTWYHFAMVRNGTSITTYIDGTQTDTFTTSLSLVNNAETFLVGGDVATASYYTGHFDEFRYSVGIARWTAAFTPPTGEYGPDGRITTFLTSGTTWTVPSDWNSLRNTIEVIGGGGGGGGTTSLSTRAGSGGGGGAYSRTVNASLTPSTNVTYAVGAGTIGSGSSGTADPGGDSYLCNSTSNCASISGSAVIVGAKGGGGATSNTGGAVGAGGASASGVGTVKYSGGSGVIGVVGASSGGGGGAAGPRGAGETAPAVSTGSPGVGGRGGAGYGGLGGGDDTTGSTGNEWGFGFGSGGGGGTRNTEATGLAGGTYGGGGGGFYSTFNNGSGGTGGNGIIVITYYPSTAPGVTINVGGKFLSNLDVRGLLSKGSGTFVIDHPTSPATKLLYHSFVESPDVKNIYDGVADLDKNGEVTIRLPSYFEALNKDFRYLYFPIDSGMPGLYVKKEIESNEFTIGGGVPNGKVSWQVTGIRHDPYILANPINTEVDKGPDALKNIGECLYEPACI